MEWLDDQRRHGHELFDFARLSQFGFEGRRVPLMDRQRGIRVPVGMKAALSIRTRFTPPGQRPPYEDAEGPDGLLRYKYRADPAGQRENIALREAHSSGVPLIWFVAVEPAAYVAIYPIWIIADEPRRQQFAIAFDGAQRHLVHPGDVLGEDGRHYIERITRLRLHQPLFRARVLLAYDHQCAICRLRHSRLLDAAHILPDGHPLGIPVVPNGLSLCKMHHAAYDQDIVGIRPDLVVEVRGDIRSEVDGPMLVHGLQEMDGASLTVPMSRRFRPDPNRLEERYEAFRRAG